MDDEVVRMTEGGDSSKKRLNFTKLEESKGQHEREFHQLTGLFEEALLMPNRVSAVTKTKTTTTTAVPQSPMGVIVEAESGLGKTVLLDRLAAYLRHRNTTQQIIHGNSNAALEEDDTNDCNTSHQVIVGFCKFEERATSASEPFQALHQAMKQVVQQLLVAWRQQDCENAFRDVFRRAVNGDMELLVSILPCLRDILLVPEQEQQPPSDDLQQQQQSVAEKQQQQQETKKEEEAATITFEAFGDMTAAEWRFERFRFAFRTLIRCIARHAVLVLIVDDIHWAEADSLAILRTLVEDTVRQGGFFLVGACRTLGDFPLFQRFLDGLPAGKIKRVRLHPLSSEAIKSMLLLLFSSECDTQEPQDNQTSDDDDNDLGSLVKILLAKTGGNTFVLLQFLRLLVRKQLIYHNDDKNQWQWDTNQITDNVDISEAAEELVAENLSSIQDETKSALIVAATFGVSQFAAATVVHAIPALNAIHKEQCEEEDDPYTVRRSTRDLQKQLDRAAESGFLETTTTPGHFRFAHDRIRYAAYSLLPDGDAAKQLHLRIGRQLRSWMDTEAELGLEVSGLTEDLTLLHATQQLNAGADLLTDDWELFDLAELNFQAAELEAKKSSFSQSVEYLQMGLRHLGQDRWTRHYQLTLKLNVALCRMQYCLGHSEECLQTADEVFAHAKVFEDKRPVYHTKVLCLSQSERAEEAMQLLWQIFDILGEPFPTSFIKLKTILEFKKIDRKMKTLSDEEILQFSDAADKKLETSSEFIDRLINVSLLFSTKVVEFQILNASLRMLSIVLERKGSPVLAHAIGTWATFLMFFERFEEGIRFSKLAQVLARRVRDRKPGLSRHIEVAYWLFIHHWHLPAREAIQPLSNICDTLWRLGYLEYVHLDRCALLRHRFLCGESLDSVALECERTSETLRDFKQDVHVTSIAPLCQAVYNLRIPREDPSTLTGEYMNEKEDLPRWGNLRVVMQHKFFAMILSYHFGELDRARHFLEEMDPSPFTGTGGPMLMAPMRLFYAALIYLATARETKQNKFRRKARPMIKKLKAWTEKGAVNCHYMYRLALAEDLGLSPRKPAETVFVAYNDAIFEAEELGMIHHVALAHELLGVFQLGRSRTLYASKALAAAVVKYREWGALAKVQQLELLYHNVLIETEKGP